MNANDSDWLARSLEDRGFTQTSFDDASIYIINTCSVRDKPEQKVYSELGRITHICERKKRKNITICVGGCVAQQVGETLAKRFPLVRLVFGTDGVPYAPKAIEQLVESPRKRINLLDFVDHYEERTDTWKDGKVSPTVFVNIMQGCNNFCTYCIVPYVRGRQKSRTPQAVLQECKSLLAGGAREITLLGQNVNSYGQDALVNGTTFTQLLYQVAELPGLERLRIVTPHPKDIAPELIQAFADIKSLCPRLHLPMQAGSDKILRLMGRKYDTAQYLRIVEQLNNVCPDIVLSTDVIVGFPGETDEDFEDTMKTMAQVGFGASFSFVYSDRPLAKASLLPNKVERKVALERLSRLQAWQDATTDKLLSSMIGKTYDVLLESTLDPSVVLATSADTSSEHQSTGAPSTSPVIWQGKSPHWFSTKVQVEDGQDYTGKIVPVQITEIARQVLKGKQVGTPW